MGTPPQARAKAPVASEQTPEGDKTGAVGPAQVLDGQGKAPATAAQPKGLAAAAEEPPLADRGSTVAQEAAPAGASTPIEGVAGASPSSLEKGENDSLPKAAVAADSGEAPAAKELSISPIVDDEAGADTANGDLPSPAQDGISVFPIILVLCITGVAGEDANMQVFKLFAYSVSALDTLQAGRHELTHSLCCFLPPELESARIAVGIWDRLPATSLQPAQASGDNSSSPSGSKENIPMQAQSVPAPAPAPAMGPKPAGVFLIPDAGDPSPFSAWCRACCTCTCTHAQALSVALATTWTERRAPPAQLLCMPAGAASKGDAVSKPAQGPAQSNPVALPSEVSGFRMERRKRTATAPPAVEPLATPANGSGELARTGGLPAWCDAQQLLAQAALRACRLLSAITV